jgi:hypothetical protein
MRRWILPLLLAQVVGRAAPAVAASLSVAPEAPCLDAAELAARVESELGTPLGAAVPLRFELSASRRGQGYEARLDVVDGASSARRRVVEAADCTTLQETLAVAITLALAAADAGAPSPLSSPELPAASGASGGAAQASMHDAPPPGAPAVASERNGWVPSLSAALLVDAGTLPAASLGAGVGVALDVGRVQFQALGTLLFDREVDLAGVSPDAAARLGFVGAGLLACTPLFEPGEGLSTRVCLGWELGQLTGEGRRVARPERGSVLWSAPRIDLGGRVALPESPWGIAISLGAEAPLNRDDFTLGSDVVVHRPPALVGRAAVGVDLALE